MNTVLKEFSDGLPEWVRAYVLPALAGTLLAFAAYSVYDWRKEAHNREISVLYWKMEEAIRDEEGEAAAENFALLQRDGDETQISFAAARIAGFQHDQGQYEQAAANYDTVIARSPFPTMRDLARLRKARVLIAAGGEQEDELASLFQSLEGTHPVLLRTANILSADTRAAAGDFQEARELYSAVLQEMASEEGAAGNELMEIIRLKLAILDSDKVSKLSRQARQDKPEAEPEEAAESEES